MACHGPGARQSFIMRSRYWVTSEAMEHLPRRSVSPLRSVIRSSVTLRALVASVRVGVPGFVTFIVFVLVLTGMS